MGDWPTREVQAELYGEVARRAAAEYPSYGLPAHPEDVVSHVVVALDGAALLLGVLRDRGVEIQ